MAKIVTFDGLTAPVVTDGPFQEIKEWVAGYMIVDVESEGRAIEIAGRYWPCRDPAALRCSNRSTCERCELRRRALTSQSDVEALLRELAPQVLGVLARRYGDFDAAEDAVQEALLAASVHWPRDGIPAGPRGWLIQVAERRLIDQWRSEQSRRNRETAAALQEQPGREVSAEDDTLTVLFMCCHPALTPASAIALTLRAVGGLTTAEIGRAFMVDEATMAQRISRAKQRIKASGVPFRMPAAEEQRAERLRASSTSSTSSSTRGTRAARGGTSPRRAVGRGDPADEDGARDCSPTTAR